MEVHEAAVIGTWCEAPRSSTKDDRLAISALMSWASLAKPVGARAIPHIRGQRAFSVRHRRRRTIRTALLRGTESDRSACEYRNSQSSGGGGGNRRTRQALGAD